MALEAVAYVRVGAAENALNSGFILKVESVRFVDGLDGGMRERKELRTLPGFGLSNWKEIIFVLSCSDSPAFLLLPHFLSFHL